MNNEQVTTPAPVEEKTNVVKSTKREFGLELSPDAYVISIHVRNMMATYGPEYVRDVLVELFLKPSKPSTKPPQTGVVNE